MNIRPLVPVLLLVALFGCSEPKKDEAPKKQEQTSTAAVDAEVKSQSAAQPAPEPAPAPPQEERLKSKELEEGVRQAAAEQADNLIADNNQRDAAAGNVSLRTSKAVPAVLYESRIDLSAPIVQSPAPQWNRESYNAVNENGFIRTANDPLSTFSIDVDTASYSNVRRFINQGQMPPPGAVRIEEMINYFSYSYPQPDGEHPFSVTTELGPCPWKNGHKVVRIGLKAKDIDKKDLPPSNLVFLIDVSGSMSDANKLPLLKQAMKMLVRQLNAKDRIAIVVYAGSDHLALEPTPGSDQGTIFNAIDSLGAGGSTHASSGIVTAYQLAAQTFMPGGNNRVILASDGDFNVGVTSRDALQKLIEEKRQSGIYLTVLGFGMGNYHDDTMEILADKGNGNYAYIDNLLEAKKVMVKEMSGTLFALAKDVKIQVEFNPVKVGAYRLIGYENRALADEDFNDDKKDAGEIGVGHTVTALYELIPVGGQDVPSVDPLKYQQTDTKPAQAALANELMTVKLRYKPLQSDKSVLLDTVVQDNDSSLDKTSNDFRFAAAVAGYGMLLTGSEQAGGLNWQQVLDLAKNARGQDEDGWRAEFIRLVETTELLAKE
ncbi:VWFA domain-containing protein [Candidatus Electronema halotolerans]